MWIIDMIVFGVLYVTLTVLTLAPIIYWLVDLVDIVIKDITNGDKPNYLRIKYLAPFMQKCGFALEDYHLVDCQGSFFKALLIAVSCTLCLVGGVVLLIIYLQEGIPPYVALTIAVTKITPYCTWLIIPTGYFVIRGLLQKGYTLIKKVNSLPSSPVDKQQ